MEQGHGSASFVHRPHKRHINPVLANRLFVHMFRGLASEATNDPELERSFTKVRKLELKAPRMASGFNCFHSGIVWEAKTHIPPGENMSRGDYCMLMQRAHLWWDLLDETDQAQYNLRGQAMAVHRLDQRS